MMDLKLIRFAILRMMRSILGHVLLIVVPIALISILGLVSSYLETDQSGRPPMDWLSISFVLAFQLFGGSYSMSYIKEDLLTSRKWRMYSLPLNPASYSYSILIASTLFSMIQGLCIILFTKFVYGVEWGNLLWVLLVLFAIAILSQIVGLILTFIFKNFKLAERVQEVFGIGSMIFAGMIFGLPNNSFFNFMSTYGNPISLGQNAIYGMMDGAGTGFILLNIGILFAASLVLLPVTHILGKRKLS
ncbi:ABC transporter permease [Bacillus horti]|uniref:ABC-2 type transport system permease protein n=1 Tax=Caldalkalibacillus horti TaxID=77523 RepID=A0ABT9VYE4_9BACI|nr:ABC transporter permease [Bacillus horti]MDQ0166018.1 ABC-2 type transport system permease protein [Bacillus horti]